MKILWIVNTIFPEPSKILGIPSPFIGGWMYGMALQLSKAPYMKLAVATVYSGKDFKKMDIDGILYYLLPCTNMLKYDESLEKHWEKIVYDFRPDIIHINGTESPIGLACMRILPNANFVISIQGLVSVYNRYYSADISNFDIIKNITFRNLIKRDSIFQLKNQFFQRGVFEKEYFERTKHIIGRTNWDYAHTKALNRELNYHTCNESLRDSFYLASKWSNATCEKHTIFLSQAHYPIKGLHQVIKAISLLISDYPDIKIKIAGGNITKNNTFFDRLKLTNYGKYIKNLIKKCGLVNNVQFLESMNEFEMIRAYQKTHVFVCPSSIENSSNSIGEAQLLGVPVVASYVGGITNMVQDGETGLLYRFEEVEMLAEHINKLFKDETLAHNISLNSIKTATNRHNRYNNFKTLCNIYTKINRL